MHLSTRRMTATSLLPLLLMPAALKAEAQRLESGVSQRQLIELYTSEGCSSCPPADKFLSSLKSKNSLWKEQIPVAFHVDYWDYIGWEDPFASADNSQRQRSHAALGNVTSVYTPSFVVDGQEWKSYFHGGRIPAPSKRQPGSLTISYESGVVDVDFEPTAHIGDLQLQMAWLGAGLSTTVTAGENKGWQLRHDFVVLKQAQANLSAKSGYSYSGAFSAEGLTSAEQYALVAWLEDPRGRAVQAVGGWVLP